MTNPALPNFASWSLLQKAVFRFFFLYFLLRIAPWTWLDEVPGVGYITQYYYAAAEWVVDFFNDHWFHIAKTTIVNNGSGDTSRNWEELYTVLSLSVIISLVWGVLDRKRRSYEQAAYWLRTVVRYAIIINCFIYGIDKIFVLQMPFPLQSQLATPLGDFLPMRFSWLFIGYSAPYEIFSGLMEILAGLLLLNKRTITLGLFIGAAVFANVMVLNLCYDIPVKIFSIHLFLCCVFLLANDAKRLYHFFILNQSADANTGYQFSLPKKWMRISKIVLKIAFVILYVILPFLNMQEMYRDGQKKTVARPFTEGVYEVTVFAKNKDTIPALISDTLRWQNLIVEKGGMGSVGSTDTSFRQRYHRGYFMMVTDSINHTINFKKTQRDSSFFCSFRYDLPDSNTIRLQGRQKNDSLFVILKKSKRHFQLAEKQFHWVSEANR
jgi:hypothetical protein